MTVEDRLRATTDALSGTMRQVRPLTLPPEQPGRVSPPREPRRGRGWLIPLTAAAAVIAVAVTLVAVRDDRGRDAGTDRARRECGRRLRPPVLRAAW